MCDSVRGGDMLKAKALEVIEEELERFEERLEKLMHGMDRVRNEIRKTKLMIIIGFTALIAFQILFKMDKVLTVRAILHVFVEQGKIEDVGEALAKMPEVIDVYEVTGEYDIIATAKANDLRKLRSLISERLMKMHGVKAVTMSIVLHTYKLNGKEVFE
jgi:DNA-binding Lrp family transcriptional regulator